MCVASLFSSVANVHVASKTLNFWQGHYCACWHEVARLCISAFMAGACQEWRILSKNGVRHL